MPEFTVARPPGPPEPFLPATVYSSVPREKRQSPRMPARCSPAPVGKSQTAAASFIRPPCHLWPVVRRGRLGALCSGKTGALKALRTRLLMPCQPAASNRYVSPHKNRLRFASVLCPAPLPCPHPDRSSGAASCAEGLGSGPWEAETKHSRTRSSRIPHLPLLMERCFAFGCR